MKILKWIIIVVAILFVAFLGFNAAQDSKITLEESIEIDAPASAVFAEIIDFESWGNWSAWNKMDPNMEQSYEGEKGKVGFKNSWKSSNQNVGVGSQEIVELEDNKYMKSKMKFEGFDADNFASFTLTENDGKTKVVWDFDGGETPFMARFFNALIKPAIRESYKNSLADLKRVVESKPVEVPNPMNLEIVEVEGIKIISVRDTTTPSGISNMLRDLYTELAIYMGVNEQVKMNGMPIGIYHSYSEDMVDMEAAFPISGDAQSSGRIMVGSTPAGKSLRGIHMGDYNASESMHFAIEKYAKASNIELKGMCWEIYANDPEKVDSADIRTEIYYPIQ